METQFFEGHQPAAMGFNSHLKNNYHSLVLPFIKLYYSRNIIIYDNFYLHTRQFFKLEPSELLKEQDVNYNFPPFSEIAQIFPVNFLKFYYKYYISKTRYDGILLAVNLKQYNLDTGHYPNSLEELAPEYMESLPTNYLNKTGN